MPLDIGGFQITAEMENNLIYVPTVTSMVTSGLIMYLDAGNTSSYPGSGTSWADLSGNGRNATLINGPVFSSAKFTMYNRALAFPEITQNYNLQKARFGL